MTNRKKKTVGNPYNKNKSVSYFEYTNVRKFLDRSKKAWIFTLTSLIDDTCLLQELIQISYLVYEVNFLCSVL